MGSILDTLVTNRKPSGHYGADDLNRVGKAMLYIAERLRGLGYDATVSPRTDWSNTELPTQEDARHYLRDIKRLRDVLAVSATTLQVPADTRPFNAEEANDIEKILIDVEAMMKLILASARHCGQFTGWVGPTLPLPTSGGRAPRTWAELDDLGWGWDVWNRLTWYQLLYEDPDEVMK